jgi:hypothetical protein
LTPVAIQALQCHIPIMIDLPLSSEDEARILALQDEIPRDREALAGPQAALRAKQRELNALLVRRGPLHHA